MLVSRLTINAEATRRANKDNKPKLTNNQLPFLDDNAFKPCFNNSSQMVN
jgi:hypothetical protein